MKGAGHNFGIVTSVTKIYDIKNPNYAMITLIFSGDQVEDVYRVATSSGLSRARPYLLILSIGRIGTMIPPLMLPRFVPLLLFSYLHSILSTILTHPPAHHRILHHPRRRHHRLKQIHQALP